MNLFGRIAYKQFRGPQINCQPLHTHLVIMEPLARGRARCPHCDGQFWPGFGFNSHKARCAERKLILAGESGGDDTGGDGDTHCDGGSATTATPTAMNDESRPQCAVAELERHMAAAQGAPGCALAYSSWGACELTAAEVETFRFLAVSDAGDGTSRRASCCHRHAAARPVPWRKGFYATKIYGQGLGHVNEGTVPRNTHTQSTRNVLCFTMHLIHTPVYVLSNASVNVLSNAPFTHARKCTLLKHLQNLLSS